MLLAGSNKLWGESVICLHWVQFSLLYLLFFILRSSMSSKISLSNLRRLYLVKSSNFPVWKYNNLYRRLFILIIGNILVQSIVFLIFIFIYSKENSWLLGEASRVFTKKIQICILVHIHTTQKVFTRIAQTPNRKGTLSESQTFLLKT